MIDIQGQRFGRLVVIRLDEKFGKEWFWLCRCDCGNTHSVSGALLRRGGAKSCGCGKTKHGHAPKGIMSRTLTIWVGMRQRCNNPRSSAYADYGGRGITICERWSEFANFLADMGDPPPGLSLDRIDNDGPYSPDNCRWATQKQQARNHRKNQFLTLNGETLCLKDWAAKLGMNQPTLWYRVNKLGWSIEKALTAPSRSR